VHPGVLISAGRLAQRRAPAAKEVGRLEANQRARAHDGINIKNGQTDFPLHTDRHECSDRDA
jgi:hypothetical protein